MNWVEKKKLREKALGAGAPGLWNELRAALQDACDSYNREFATKPSHAVKCSLENGRRIRIEKTIRTVHSTVSAREDAMTVVVSFETEPPSIAIAGDGPVKSWTIQISADEATAFLLMLGSRMTIEEASESILGALFFPTGKYTNSEY